MHIDATIQWGIGVFVSGAIALYSLNRANRAAEREAVRRDAEFEGETKARLTSLEQFRASHEAHHEAMGNRRDAR